jgi:hypothetical protein
VYMNTNSEGGNVARGETSKRKMKLREKEK